MGIFIQPYGAHIQALSNINITMGFLLNSSECKRDYLCRNHEESFD